MYDKFQVLKCLQGCMLPEDRTEDSPLLLLGFRLHFELVTKTIKTFEWAK